MQAISSVYLEANASTYARKLRHDLTSTTLITTRSDTINQAIATLLSSVGVDATYEIRGDDDVPYLWIRNFPVFFSCTTNSTGLTMNYGNGDSVLINWDISSTKSDTVSIVFSGNPNGFFFVRFFGEAGTYKLGFIVGDLGTTFSQTVYPFILRIDQFTSSFKFMDPETWNTTGRSLSSMHSKYNTVYTPMPAVSDKVILIPISAYDPTNELPPVLFVKGVFMFPHNGPIPNGYGMSSIYQREILADGRKFLVTKYDSNSLGMIALEDDDPLISEEEFLAGVDT